MPSFLHPWILVMLAAVLLPPIIEWLFRRRKRQVELPTIRFLLDNQEQKKVRRQDQLLLLLRMAAIFLLVLGIARPLWNQAGLNGPRPRNVVLLIDATASMNQQLVVSTSFALAQKKAAAVIRSLPAGTVVTVASFSDGVTPIAENETDLHTVAARVESLRAGCGAAAVASAVGWVRDSLTTSDCFTRGETDCCLVFRPAWKPSRPLPVRSRSRCSLGNPLTRLSRNSRALWGAASLACDGA